MEDIREIRTNKKPSKRFFSEAENEIKNFKKSFLKTYNIKLQIFYDMNMSTVSHSIARDLNIHDIYDSINELIEDEFPGGLKENTRETPFIYYRHIFRKLAYDLNRYRLREIGEYTGNHHATVLHSLKVVDDLLSTRCDKRFNFAYDRIINYLITKYNDE